MMIHGVVCPNCKDFIYSRTRHDFRTCTCGDTSIDGGQTDYIKLSAKNMKDIQHLTMEIKTTLGKLYDDWNLKLDKLGLIPTKTIKRGT